MNEAEMKAELERLRAENAPAQDEGKGRHHPEGERKRRASLYGMERFRSLCIRSSGSASWPARLRSRHSSRERLKAEDEGIEEWTRLIRRSRIDVNQIVSTFRYLKEEWGMTTLRELVVPIQSLYLDPNNPRFADIQDRLQPIASDRVTEQGVQEKALARILDDRFEVTQLKDSIRTIGFLTVDRLVVIPLSDSKYIVIEGNRRSGAIKSLLEDHKNGEADLTEEVQTSLRDIAVLVIDEPEIAKREHFARVLQGVRHLSGIRPWGPYQQHSRRVDDRRWQRPG